MTLRNAIAAGFADPVHDAQQVFRNALEALSRPGRVQTLPALAEAIPGLQPAAAAIALTLVDFETPVWLSPACRAAADFLRFHCGCTIVAEPAAACFAFASGWNEVPPFDCFNLGDDVEPESSTTLVVEVERLEKSESLVLTGPGIEQRQRLATGAIPAERIAERTALQVLFPRGIDLFLTHDRQVCGLPRTTRVQILGSEACMSR
ncbi:phosphonate C-P lyase system protein PhnH [Azoarcus taiwanensis]|uniref:Phosphonate C-P lyase system protein PhnH n=1 Tax=Azoarcus taiwanensis TaxID=666964 RepID=A0A972FA50_9RHOO|nr:phosphonate C-P lyase system protein PhnH [Azoarcus taiwanensis]NMG05203.1 phosphonate C-P lyase system protein PhnH [Azoarcus taiwanensis]